MQLTGRVLRGFLVILLLSASSGHADPLTTPLATTATQYVVQAVTFDVASGAVSITVQLQDATGAALKTQQVWTTMTDLGLTAAQQATLKRWATDYLKARGIIN